jgi:hypothetical protein
MQKIMLEAVSLVCPWSKGKPFLYDSKKCDFIYEFVIVDINYKKTVKL